MAKSQHIVILTGSGISAESGIPTFRGSNGLWNGHRIEEVATPGAFAQNPKLVQDFYNMRRQQLKTVQPNQGHIALTELERQWQGDFFLITQNVDDLHERAGSSSLLHMHGELAKARCTESGQVFEQSGDILESSLCPCCSRSGTLRPHIVWFGAISLHFLRNKS